MFLYEKVKKKLNLTLNYKFSENLRNFHIIKFLSKEKMRLNVKVHCTSIKLTCTGGWILKV